MPEIRSGRPGPDLNRRKKSPARIVIGVAAVAVIAVGVGWGLTHLPGGGGGGAGGPPGGGGGRGGGRGGGGGFGGFGGRNNITVGTASASIGAIPIQLDALGTVTPPVTANITSRIAGQLMAVYFTEGQTVKKGEKLALIDPRPYTVALEQTQGQMARDQASLNQARVDLKRYQTLLAQNSIAAQQVDTQAALVKQDEGAVKSDQANVDNAKLNLAYTSITAPVSGRVGLRQIDVGNYINGPGTTLMIITQVDPIDVVYTIPEDNVPQITARQRSGATLTTTVFNRAGGDILAQGRLSTLDNVIDTSTGTVKAKARFDNGNGALFPNQFVNVRMLVDVLCNAVVVPATAVRHGSQGDYVFTVGSDRVAHQVTVTTGPGTGETVSVTKGLQGGETVITEGGDRLRDGSQVNLPGQAAPQGGSGFQRKPGDTGSRRGNFGGQGGQGGQGFQRGQFAQGQGGQGRGGQGQGGQGQGGQGAQGQGGQFRGQGGQGFRGPNGQGGQGGQGFRGRGAFNRNGQGQNQANVAAPDKDTQARAAGEAIPVFDAASACSAKANGGRVAQAKGAPGKDGQGGQNAQGAQDYRANFRRQFGQGQGGQGQGGPGQGGPGQPGQGRPGFPPGGFRGPNGQFPNGGQGYPGGFRRGQGQGGQGQGGQGGNQSQSQGSAG